MSVPPGLRFRLGDILAMSRSCPGMSRRWIKPGLAIPKASVAAPLQLFAGSLKPLLERVLFRVPAIDLAGIEFVPPVIHRDMG